ncbi:MAG TPA: DMT family transporter [Nocardioides sp.]|nr:DMT family transporter [Nocardioides sp.]
MGPIYCLSSAFAFGLMAIFAKLSYADGATVGSLLVVRFGLAALVLVAVALGTGTLRRLGRRTVVVGLTMGAVGYAAQAGLYLAAVSRVPASQVALAYSVYPVLVMLAALLIGRERASRRRLAALVTASAGIALVLGGAAAGAFDPFGAGLALGAAGVYTCYILIGDRVVGDAPPLPLTAMVCTGAFLTWTLVGVLRGDLALGRIGVQGWGGLTALALVSTVAAILLFFAGLAHVGPTVASLLSIVEPVVTVVAAAVVFGEQLTAAQVLGGALVLAAVVLVQWQGQTQPVVLRKLRFTAPASSDITAATAAGR